MRGRNRSQMAPAIVESAITTSAGDRCQVSRCNGSSIGQAMRITANEKNNEPAPTKRPDNQPRMEAPRFTSDQSTSHGNVPNITVSMAHIAGQFVRSGPANQLCRSAGQSLVRPSLLLQAPLR